MTTQLIDVNDIEKNSWNPNVMSDAEFRTLKEDMRIHGVHGVDPILVSLKGVYQLPVPIDELPGGAWDKAFEVKGYVIVDGEHRWRAAKELGWKQVFCESDNIREEDPYLPDEILCLLSGGTEDEIVFRGRVIL